MQIRNIAIIAHVDHGKTTLVDGLLKQTHTFRDNQAEMAQTTILDKNDQERERGITILAKNTAVIYKDTKINIIDTPGHADFGGEVERVLNMAEGALLIVDAAEGPLPQTKFVLKKALSLGLKIILVVNKIDKRDARPQEVLTETENLFLSLTDNPDHLEFPVIYAIGREGKAWKTLPQDMTQDADLTALFETILENIPAPQIDPNLPFKMLVSSLDFDTYQGRYAIGRIKSGVLNVTNPLLLLDPEGKVVSQARAEKIFVYEGLNKKEIESATPGDIIAITGFNSSRIGYTLTDPSDPTALPTIKLEEPTIRIVVGPNTSPISGREGKFSTARQLQDRLLKEKETNIGMIIQENPSGSGYVISGRGELHLAVLLETLRREGFELEVGKPQVIFKEENNQTLEPFEELTIDIPEEFVGVITTELGKRKANLSDMHSDNRGNTRMVYEISSRNLLGFRNSILTQTKGTGIFATEVIGYKPLTDATARYRNGVLVATESGQSTGYAINSIQERGSLFVPPGVNVYEGMIVGLNSREDDVDVNICKEKGKTNVRSANKEMGYALVPPTIFSLEQCLDFLEDDELLEITPQNLRLRKRHLSKTDRIRATRQNN